MLSSPLPEGAQARNWSVEDLNEEIFHRRAAAACAVHAPGDMDFARTLISSLVGLRIVTNLKEGKVWNDGFRR